MIGVMSWMGHKKYRLALRLRGLVVGQYITMCGGRCGKGLLVDRGFFMKHPPHSGLTIGNGVAFGRNVTLDVPRGGRLDIRDDVSFTMNIIIAAAEHVFVDEKTQVAEFTSIRDADHGIVPGVPMREQMMASAPVAIGKDVWIGRGVAVLKGAKIGDGAVIGANSVVRGSIDPHAIAVGVPARVIKFRHD